MSRLRLVLAWLLMAALPLQGMAAASMLFCGSQMAARAGQAAQSASAGGHHAATGMSSHGHGSDHASHGHAAAHGGADPAASHAPGVGEDAAQSHSCPICASCSQAQAVGGFDPLPAVAAVPSTEPSQPPIRVSSRALTLPDKPPRA